MRGLNGKHVPVTGRAGGTGKATKPGKTAAFVAFLAFDDAAFATGHVYVMDGAETTGGLCSWWSHE